MEKPPSHGRQQHQRKPQSGKAELSKTTKWVEVTDSSTPPPEDPPPIDTDTDDLPLFTIGEATRSSPIQVEVTINGQPLTMEVDTGAAVSLISEATVRSLFPRAKLQPSTAMLRTYTGEPMAVVGELSVDIQYKQQGPKKLSLVVVKSMFVWEKLAVPDPIRLEAYRHSIVP